MAQPNEKSLKEAAGGKPAPQVWNPAGGTDSLGDYVVWEGTAAGGAKVQMTNDGTDQTDVAVPAGATGIRGWLSALYNLFFSGTAKVTATITGSSVTQATLQTAAAATGNGALLTVTGLTTVAFTLSGTFVATVTFEATTVATSPQASDWFAVNAHQVGTSNQPVPTATVPGIYRASVVGFASVRARVSSYTSGNVTVTGIAVAVEDASKIFDGTDASGVTVPTGGVGIRGWLSGIYSNILTLVQGLGTPGSAVPAKVNMIGATDGTLAQALKVDVNKGLLVRMFQVDSGNISRSPEAKVLSDSLNMGSVGLLTQSLMSARNSTSGGTSVDSWYNNIETTLLASAARTTSPPATDQTLFNHRGVDVIIDVTAIVAAPSVTFIIEVKDSVSGKYVVVLTSAPVVAVTGATPIRLRVYPGIKEVANLAASDIMRRTWRCRPVHANTDSIAYSIGKADLL